MSSRLRVKMAIVLGTMYFVLGMVTLPHYGINWDTINHLPRGQAFLNYFLTGNRDFSNLPEWEPYWQDPSSLAIKTDKGEGWRPRRSLYQYSGTTFDWYLARGGEGHPPASDILSSAFNLVFFQKLGVINDIDAYRMYGVLLAAVLVGLVFVWVSDVWGGFAGFAAAFSLAMYPLFWSESHFNTEKDVPETVYWSLFLYALWKGVKEKKIKWILGGGVFMGLALGTKFNILFAGFVIGPWLIWYWGEDLFRNSKKKYWKYLKRNILMWMALLIVPVIGGLIFVLSWPYLWADPIARIGEVVSFYKGIGTTTNVDMDYTGPFGMNLYPLKWIIYTTPLGILALFLMGFVVLVRATIVEKKKIGLLVLLWVLVPIARVSWPGSNIYGGVRQIMEYIPGMAIVAGVGAGVVGRYTAGKLVVIAMFVCLAINLIRIHPNENVFFNPLIGGLAGAKEENIPSWGNTFGAAYRQGINWINDNAEPGARVLYAYEFIPNIPWIHFRRDFEVHNKNRSGLLREGEYAITLVYDGVGNRTYYDAYLERFLEPKYVVEVDEVEILKVWKNDAKSTRKGYLREAMISGIIIEKIDGGFQLDLGSEYTISRIAGVFQTRDCEPLEHAYAEVSVDGYEWVRLPGVMPEENWSVSAYGRQPEERSFIQPVAAEKARYVNYIVSPIDACLRDIESVIVFHLVDLYGSYKNR